MVLEGSFYETNHHLGTMSHSWRGWSLLVLLTVAIVSLGYGVFVFLLRDFNPTAGTLSLLLFALIAGVATFFSPCSFPLMPGYLTRHLQLVDKNSSKKVLSSTLSNGLAAAGVLLFDLALGLGIVLLGSTFGASLAISSPQPNVYVQIFRGRLACSWWPWELSASEGREYSTPTL